MAAIASDQRHDLAKNKTFGAPTLLPTRIANTLTGIPAFPGGLTAHDGGFFGAMMPTETSPTETIPALMLPDSNALPGFASAIMSTQTASVQLSDLVPHATSTTATDFTSTSATDIADSITAAVTSPPTTLITSTAKQASSVIVGPPVSVSAPSIPVVQPSTTNPKATTAETTQAEPGSPQCTSDPACVAHTNDEAHRRGIIAGSVIAVFAAGCIIFGLYMFIRRKLHTPIKRKEEPGWIEVKPKRKSFLIEKVRPEKDISNAPADLVRLQERPHPAVRPLGEPGPAVSTKPRQRLPDYRVDATNRLSNTSTLSDPFRTPEDTQLNQSQIGLAVSRYSSTIDRPLPIPPQSHLTLPVRATDEEDTLKRASSFTTQTEDTDKENEPRTLFIGTAQPTRLASARRHSLTPRIVNIVAGSGNKDRLRSDGADDSGDEGLSKRSTFRARSSSPMKSSKLYSGSPAKLNTHFGIQTWGREAGRTSSELLRHARDGSDDSMAGRGRPRERKSDQRIDDGDIKSPPTSFTLLGRTLSEAKRKLRNSDGTTSSASTKGGIPAIPGSVTISRGGKNWRSGG